MHGIAGWFGSFDKINDSQATLVAMGNKIFNSKKNSTQSFISSNFNVLHTDSTENSNLAKEDYFVATYTGNPHWSDDKLQKEAENFGHARALIKAYKEYNIKLLDILHGSFSICISDTKNKKILLAIDRIGIQPMAYTAINGKGIIFGSTANSITANPAGDSSINMQSVYQYLFFHAVPCPHSIYNNQKKLKPGQFIMFDDGDIRTGHYWNPDYIEDTKSSFTELSNKLMSLLKTSVERCNIDGNAGAFLSGGVDSSTVSGVLSELSSHKPHTYSIGFNAAGYDEIEFARTTSEHFQTVQHEYYVTPQDVVDIIPTIAAFYDEPFGNSSVVPTYYCAKLAKENGTNVLLAGDGGDELFGGNVRYAQQGIFELYYKIPELLRTSLLEPLFLKTPMLGSIKPFNKVRSYIKQAKTPMPDRLQSYNFLVRTSPEDVLHRDIFDAISTQAPYEVLRHNYSSINSNNMMHKMLHLDWIITLADNDLRKVNQMCSLAEINVQYPMLDDDLLDFSTHLTTKHMVNRNQLRYFFKRSMKGFLPDRVLSKSKHGFGLPFGVWMKTYKPLQDISYDSLNSLKKRNIISHTYINQLIDKHQHDHAAYYGEFIWVLMMLELWFQTHSDG